MKKAMVYSMTLLSLGCQPNWEQKVIEEITALEQRMVQTQLAGDYQAQLDMFSDEYGYIDISGKRVTKEQLGERRDEDHLKGLTLEAHDLEVIPLSRTTAVSRGRWKGKSIYYGGIPRQENSRYMAIWRKENGAWKMLADQVTPIVNRTLDYPVVAMSNEQLGTYEGHYKLSSEPSVVFALTLKEDTVRMTIPNQLGQPGIAFLPMSDTKLFARERPWQIQFHADDLITFTSWDMETTGIKVD